jgi:hypothetical protein
MHAVPSAGPAHAGGARVAEAAQRIGAGVKLDVDPAHLMLSARSSASSSLSRRPTSIPIRSRKLIRLLRSLPASTLTFQILLSRRPRVSPVQDGDPCIAADTIGAAAADMHLPSWPTSGTSITVQAQLVCSAAAIACPERT